MRFQGKIALVTGAARGVGKATVTRFSQEGATVVINDIDLKAADSLAQQITRTGSSGIALKADVSKNTEVEAMINRVIDDYGKIDILVNNAAVLAESIPILELEEKDIDSLIN